MKIALVQPNNRRSIMFHENIEKYAFPELAHAYKQVFITKSLNLLLYGLRT